MPIKRRPLCKSVVAPGGNHAAAQPTRPPHRSADVDRDFRRPRRLEVGHRLAPLKTWPEPPARRAFTHSRDAVARSEPAHSICTQDITTRATGAAPGVQEGGYRTDETPMCRPQP